MLMKLQVYMLLLFIILCSKQNIFAQINIGGSPKACKGTKQTFVVENPQANHRYFWSAGSGAVVLNSIGDTTTIVFDVLNNVLVTLHGKDTAGNIVSTATKEIVVSPLPIPIIYTHNRVGCEKLDEPNDENNNELFLPDDKCQKTCANTLVTYEAKEILDNMYSWTVNGGTIVGSSNGTTVQVQWGGGRCR